MIWIGPAIAITGAVAKASATIVSLTIDLFFACPGIVLRSIVRSTPNAKRRIVWPGLSPDFKTATPLRMSLNPTDRPIVFLHLPKTGGQTIHHAIAGIVGETNVSPIRVNAQTQGGPTFPPGFRFHSGHLDWVDLDTVPGRPFVFSVLRDPMERLGSFYFYMRAKALDVLDLQGEAALAAEERRIIGPPDAFFFPDDLALARKTDNRWANLATTYLATRRLQGRTKTGRLTRAQVLDRAIANAERLDGLYQFGAFGPLEADIFALTGKRPVIADHRANPGPLDVGQSRWNALLAAFETDAARHKIADFVAEDMELMDRVRFRSLTA